MYLFLVHKVHQNLKLYNSYQYYCYITESEDIELICNVLVVADQLLVTRLKEMCEVALTSQCKLIIISHRL